MEKQHAANLLAANAHFITEGKKKNKTTNTNHTRSTHTSDLVSRVDLQGVAGLIKLFFNEAYEM